MSRSITPTVPLVMLEAVKLMAAVCLVPPDGHDKVGRKLSAMILSSLMFVRNIPNILIFTDTGSYHHSRGGKAERKIPANNTR